MHRFGVQYARMSEQEKDRKYADLGDRLKRAREAAGLGSAVDGAAATGANATTYRQHENGTRGFPAKTAEGYARRFGVNVAWLLTGRGSMTSSATVRMVGRVGAGAQVHLFDRDGHPGEIEYIEAPYGFGEDAEAVEVVGDSMWPAIQEGEILVYDRLRYDPVGLVGAKVVVKLSDGRMFVKLLGKKSRDGLWTLHSFNGPPMEDVDIEWAAEIRAILKR